MHERLEAFREQAELLTEPPAFHEIEQRGRSRRRRRQAVIGVAAASVLAVTGILATAGGQPPESHTANPTTPGVTPYPVWNRMITLTPGTYAMAPFSDPDAPVVHVTVPPLWNAWEGPNRFEGIRAREGNNSELLGRTDWLVGMLVLDVEEIASPQCGQTDVARGDADALIAALTQVPRLELTKGPERTHRYGTGVTHLRFEDTGMTTACSKSLLFDTATNGEIFFVNQGRDVYDAWVVETDAGPLLVWSGWTEEAPQTEINALVHMVDTLEVVQPS